MLRKVLVFLHLVILCTGFGSVQAAEIPEGRNTAMRLVAERDAIVPGEALTLAIEVKIRENWHVYWQNPGDSGDKMRLTWDLPPSFQAGDVGWPTPKRLPYGPLLNFGYEDHVAFPLTLIVPPRIEGDEVTLKARAEILVCEEICIPEFEDVSLTLPVKDSADPANENLFAQARAALPETLDAQAFWRAKDGEFIVTAYLPQGFKAREIYPLEWGLIDNPAPQKIERDNATIFTVKSGSRDLSALETLDFVIAGTTIHDARHGYLVTAHKDADVPGAPAAAGESEKTLSLMQAFLFAIIGGVLLNLMPCVFPVLSMKTLALIKVSDQERTHSQKSALAYTSGILVSFAALAVLLLGLRGAGEAIGWGFQLQSPTVVTLLSWVTVAVGFNLLGLFHIGGMGAFGEKLARGTGLTASFFTGVLAAIVATPCSAPFMAGALGAALVQPAPVAVAIILALGFGLALPFLLISFIPAFARHLPRPGAWMVSFRQFLAFPMFAASVWLVWVAAGQIGADSIWVVLGGWLVIGLLIWLARFKPNAWSKLFTIAFWLALLGLLFMLPMAQAPNNIRAQGVFSEIKVEEALAQKRPVFVYMTAKWCVTCLLNERVALEATETQKLFQDTNTLVLKGDWTFYDKAITEYLNRHGRQGVPLYVLYKDGKETVLPQILTPAIVVNAFRP